MNHPNQAITQRRVLPYPNGWFAACFSHQLRPGTVLVVPFLGQELLLYRTRSGAVRATDPYCPHQGAHLGHGGKVDGENLVCPFHGLAFGPDGSCVRTGNGTRPPRAALSHWPIQEANGMVLVWRHNAGLAPEYDLPKFDFTGFSRPRHSCHDLDGYAHDMVENSADLTHFEFLHGFKDAVMSHRLDGQRIEIELSGRWNRLPMSMRFTSYGLGYTQSESAIPGLGVRVKTLSYATPIGPLQWRFRWLDGLQVARFEALPMVLRRPLYSVFSLAAHHWFTWLGSDDFEIWNNRNYIEHPRLAIGEGCVAALRHWSRQFYPDGEAAERTFATRPTSPLIFRQGSAMDEHSNTRSAPVEANK